MAKSFLDMATSYEEVVLCEICTAQINRDQLSEHLKQCKPRRKRRLNSRRTPVNDTVNSSNTVDEYIPCEYCIANIAIDQWESHSTVCADAHRRRVERLRNGGATDSMGKNDDENEDDMMTTSIPCEQCDEQILLKDWDKHSRQCGNRTAVAASDTLNNNLDEDTLDVIHSLIPCEYCHELITILDLTSHTDRCAEIERQRVAAIVQRSEIDIIPCQYCNKSFAFESIQDHQTECQRLLYSNNSQTGTFAGVSFSGGHSYPDTWDQSTPYNLSQFTLDKNSEEYKFVAGKFNETLAENSIVRIERIQNRRWYRQYDAHRDDFIERHGRSTEMWLFHGCRTQTAVEAIMKDCFNRSHAVRCAAGQGIYFATNAQTSLAYTQPDGDQHRRMFLARVLVGRTTGGNSSVRICPEGYDTTGGNGVYVTYHDAQAYGEYLITFR